MEDASAPVRPGDLLAGKYVIDRVLGQGGMGVVVAATHATLGQRVAIKFLLPEACRDPSAVERFLREARAAVQIQSEHVARVTDVGTLETGSPYMVMEYLEGQDLAQEIEARGVIPLPEAVDYLLQALEAIAEAHAIRIVHRDLKPANLFLTRRKDGSRTIKVLDFGISKAVQEGEASLTQTSSMMGSPLYMAPEQIRNSKTVDARADVWSLGVILYECLSGRVPFGGDTLSGVLASIVADPPEPLETLRPDLPYELIEVVRHCLEKDPRRRVQSVAELAEALSPFGSPRNRISVDRVFSILGKPTAPQSLTTTEPQFAGTVVGSATPLPTPRDSSSSVDAAHGKTAQNWSSTGQNTALPKPFPFVPVALAAVGLSAVVGLTIVLTRGASESGTADSGAPKAESAVVPSAAVVAPAPVVSPAVLAPVQATPTAATAAVAPAPETTPDKLATSPRPVTGKPSKPVTSAPAAPAKPAPQAPAAPTPGIDPLAGRH